MDLSIQVKTLIVSFSYGILLSYMIISHYKYLFLSRLWYKILFSILFIFDYTIIYFLILRVINNGIFHIYFLFILVVGYIFGLGLIKKKKWLDIISVKSLNFFFI